MLFLTVFWNKLTSKVKPITVSKGGFSSKTHCPKRTFFCTLSMLPKRWWLLTLFGNALFCRWWTNVALSMVNRFISMIRNFQAFQKVAPSDKGFLLTDSEKRWPLITSFPRSKNFSKTLQGLDRKEMSLPKESRSSFLHLFNSCVFSVGLIRIRALCFIIYQDKTMSFFADISSVILISSLLQFPNVQCSFCILWIPLVPLQKLLVFLQKKANELSKPLSVDEGSRDSLAC